MRSRTSAQVVKKYFIVMMLTLLMSPTLTFGAEPLSDRLAGKILLQVENNGEAWYLEPVTKQRAFLGRPADAFRVMRELGLGISENDYTSFKTKAPQRLAGMILLRAEAHGEAYYVHSESLKPIFLDRPSDAFRVMREQGLGITNNDLDAIVVNKKYYITDEVKQKIIDFIDTLIPVGTEFSLKKVSFEGGMYKAAIDLNGDEIDSYINEELTKFFPSALDMNAVPEKQEISITKPTSGTSITKADKPIVELFVMSHCPFGTQMEKGLLPVLGVIGGTIDFE